MKVVFLLVEPVQSLLEKVLVIDIVRSVVLRRKRKSSMKASVIDNATSAILKKRKTNKYNIGTVINVIRSRNLLVLLKRSLLK